MIAAEKIPAAQYTIHMVLVKARWYVLQRMEPDRLYKFLDWAEILPALVAGRTEDTTEEFRQTLAGLGEEFPDCSGFLTMFDKDVSWNSLVAARQTTSAVQS